MPDTIAHNPTGKRFFTGGRWTDVRPEDPSLIEAIWLSDVFGPDLVSAIHAGTLKPIIGTDYGSLELTPKIRRVTQRLAVEG